MNKDSVDSFIENNLLINGNMFVEDLQANFQLISNEVRNSKILVIGGAGFIGTSYLLEILNFSPNKLVVVDKNENDIVEVIRNLRSLPDNKLPLDIRLEPIDFGSDEFYRMLDRDPKYDIVVNFAAYKHVRSEKDMYSLAAMFDTNVFKVGKLLQYLANDPPKHFFSVSTDKAANPQNFMGASKRLMELLMISYSGMFKITSARFANVAFSNGSLFAGHIHRIFNNQPLSCPNNIFRSFISSKEAGLLCVIASIIGESGDVFIPRMSLRKALNVGDLSEQFLRHLGYTPVFIENEIDARNFNFKMSNNDYPIYFFESDTDGEKLVEEFYSRDCEYTVEVSKALEVVRAKGHDQKELLEKINILKMMFDKSSFDKNSLAMLIRDFIPGFNPIVKGKNLDNRM